MPFPTPNVIGVPIDQRFGRFGGDVVVKHASDFSVNANGWVQAIGDANLLVAGNVDNISGIDDVLSCTASGAPKSLAIRRPNTCKAGFLYRIYFDYYADASCGLDFIGAGTSGAREDSSGIAVVEGSWQLGKMIYGVAQSTDAKIAAFTTISGNTIDALATNKNIYFKNIIFIA